MKETAAEAGPEQTVPSAEQLTACTVCVPSVSVLTANGSAYGAAVSTPRRVPSTRKATEPPGAVAVKVALPDSVCDALGEVTAGASLSTVSPTWVAWVLHTSSMLQSTAATVWCALARPQVAHEMTAAPPAVGTGFPRGVPSMRTRTLGAGEATVSGTTPATVAPSAGEVTAGTESGLMASYAARKSTCP